MNSDVSDVREHEREGGADGCRRGASSCAGQRRWTTSTTATTANGHDTHVTHVRWVESGRCSACGQDADADERDDQEHGRPGRRDDRGGVPATASASSATVPASIAKNHRKIACEAPTWGRCHHGGCGLGDRLQGAVEAAPRRRPGQLPARPQVDDRVDDHALPRRAWPGDGEVAPTAA